MEFNFSRMLMIVEAGSPMALLFYYPTFEYLLCIPYFNASSEPVISFFNGANPFHRVCFFCIFVRNRIYVISKGRVGDGYCDIGHSIILSAFSFTIFSPRFTD